MSYKVFVSSITAGFILCCSLVQGQTTEKIYLTHSSEMANPDRGWYRDYYSFGNYLSGSYRPLSADVLRESRQTENVTVILRLFYLHQFLNQASVSDDYLAKMQADFDAIRQAGVKCIVRFAYSDSQNAAVYDATPEIVLSHIQSLSQVLSANADAILSVQAGFIGAWGEWYYTENFAGNGYQPDETDLANRRAVVEALLDILPENIQVQVRTPAIKRSIVQSDEPISESEAYNGTNKSRVAHHNDCFLANSSDYGTYENLTTDLNYMTQETQYAIAGGETCDANNQYSDCSNAIPRMELLHWTYLNANYNQDVYRKWERQGCIYEAGLRLGYRISLVSAQLPDSVDKNAQMPLALNFENRGYAAPNQYKPIYLVLQNTETHTSYKLRYQGTNDDVRFWLPGKFSTTGNITLPDTLPDGNYTMGLYLTDQYETLANRPEYCIRFANTAIWDSVAGINQLQHMLVVGNGGIGQLPARPNQLEGSALGENEIKINWTTNATDETGTEIYYCVASDSTWELLAETAAGTSEFTATGLLKGTTYNFAVRSKNQYGFSDWSNIATITTLGVDVTQLTTDDFSVYPNPLNKGNLFIINPTGDLAQISILNNLGQVLVQFSTDHRLIEIPNTTLKPGIYIVKINAKIKTIGKTVVVN